MFAPDDLEGFVVGSDGDPSLGKLRLEGSGNLGGGETLVLSVGVIVLVSGVIETFVGFGVILEICEGTKMLDGLLRGFDFGEGLHMQMLFQNLFE
jgi:hypothetical protein